MGKKPEGRKGERERGDRGKECLGEVGGAGVADGNGRVLFDEKKSGGNSNQVAKKVK